MFLVAALPKKPQPLAHIGAAQPPETCCFSDAMGVVVFVGGRCYVLLEGRSGSRGNRGDRARGVALRCVDDEFHHHASPFIVGEGREPETKRARRIPSLLARVESDPWQGWIGGGLEVLSRAPGSSIPRGEKAHVRTKPRAISPAFVGGHGWVTKLKHNL